MKVTLKSFDSLRDSPSGGKIATAASRLASAVHSLLNRRHDGESHMAARRRAAALVPLDPPVESEMMDILSYPAFRRSVSEVKDFTCLDIVRLANLWNLAQFAESGLFLEVGSFRGGTALHICNAVDDRGGKARFLCFDPFESGGFEGLRDCDQAFKSTDFTNTRYDAVVELLAAKTYATAIQGFFPAAAEGLNLSQIAFCHLDVDIYEGTRQSLEYLAPRLAPRGLIVVDDFGHKECPGVRKAVTEFLAVHQEFQAIPMFPCQAVLLPKTLWQS